MTKKTLIFMVLAGLSFAPVYADDKAEVAAVKKTLARVFPSMEPDVVAPSALAGVYEVVYGAQVLYVSKDGRYVLQGDLIDLTNMKNITENSRSGYRKKVVDAINEKGMIVFAPTTPAKHTVTIFTDIDCGYCRKLHREIDQYLAKGIKVRYVSFPRTGKDSPSYDKAVNVWCADDRKGALTRAKAGEELPKKSCAHPVDRHMDAAEQVGVSGTPTIVLANGDVIPGYVPADRLLQLLEGDKVASKK